MNEHNVYELLEEKKKKKIKEEKKEKNNEEEPKKNSEEGNPKKNENSQQEISKEMEYYRKNVEEFIVLNNTLFERFTTIFPTLFFMFVLQYSCVDLLTLHKGMILGCRIKHNGLSEYQSLQLCIYCNNNEIYL